MSRSIEQEKGSFEQFIEHPLQPGSKLGGFADEVASLLSSSEACYKAFGQPGSKSTNYECLAVTADKTKDDEISESRDLSVMASKAWNEGDAKRALDLMEKAMEIQKKYEIKNPNDMTFFGFLLLQNGRYAEARDYLEQALVIELSDGSDRDCYWIQANIIQPLAEAEAALGNYPQADRYFQEVIDYAREHGRRPLLEESLEMYLNDVLYKVWDPEKIAAVVAELIYLRLTVL